MKNLSVYNKYLVSFQMGSQTEAKEENEIDMLFLQLKDDEKWHYSTLTVVGITICSLTVPHGIKLILIGKNGETRTLNPGAKITRNKSANCLTIHPCLYLGEFKYGITGFKIEETD